VDQERLIEKVYQVIEMVTSLKVPSLETDGGVDHQMYALARCAR